jgi:hypothetical protein
LSFVAPSASSFGVFSKVFSLPSSFPEPALAFLSLLLFPPSTSSASSSLKEAAAPLVEGR